MKKIFFLAVLSIVIASAANAQGAMQDVVYLKNGSVIRGIIIEQVPNESIKIETREGNIFVYKMEEVSKFTKETMPQQHRYVGYSGGQSQYNPKYNGYMGTIQFGYGVGIDKYKASRVNLNLINGYKFSPHYYMGAGMGLNYYFSYEDYTVPLFLYLRSDFLKSDASPFFSMSAGYNVFLGGSGFFEGLILEPSLGISFRASNASCYFLSIGCAVDQIKYYYINNYGGIISDKQHKLTGAINLKLGFIFQ